MTNEEALAPCPFCGGTGGFVPLNDPSTRYVAVVCRDCKARTWEVPESTLPGALPAEEVAARCWNRRTCPLKTDPPSVPRASPGALPGWADLPAHAQDLLRLLEHFPEGCTLAQIRLLLGARTPRAVPARTRKTLQHLKEKGLVTEWFSLLRLSARAHALLSRAGAATQAPPALSALALSSLDEEERRVVLAVAAHPEGVSLHALQEASGCRYESRLRVILGGLRVLELIAWDGRARVRPGRLLGTGDGH